MGIDSRYFAILLAIILILVIFLIVFVIKRVQKKNKVYKEATEDGNLDEITRKYKADIKDMLTNIENQIGDVGELEKLSKECSLNYKEEFVTQNQIIDTLLVYKTGVCRSLGISVKVKASPLPEQFLDEKDLISLLGNLLDNAIKAAGGCDEKLIDIMINMSAGQWICKIVNSKPEGERPLENGMATTKADKANHGMGTKIIDKIVKNNQGHIKRYDHGETFEVFVAIPIKETK